MITYGAGTNEDPWILKTLSLSSEYQAWREDDVLVVQVVAKTPSYQARGFEDLHAMSVDCADWVRLGNADEGKPVADGSVEAWARSDDNRVEGYYSLRIGNRGRFANYVTPIKEFLDLVEFKPGPRNNRVRARRLVEIESGRQ